MVTGHYRPRRGADPSGVSTDPTNTFSHGDDVVVGSQIAVVTTEDVDWLVRRLQAMVMASLLSGRAAG
jgi:hypothetical protein